MKNVLVISLFAMFLMVGCSESAQQNSLHEIDDQHHKVLADNLEVPWSIDKIEGTFYLTERSGNIVKIENGKTERQRVEFEKELATVSEAGLLGFVLAPNFPESNIAYSYYTYVDNTDQFNRIVTLRLSDHIWREEDVLLDKIPSGSYHHGGRIKMGPDGKLYVTTGDASDSNIAQDVDSLGGKILRMNLDGTIPTDNPFQNSYIYSYGHRNPQGIVWSPDGTFYASEHGNSAHDEINQIEAGQNYGWPIIEGDDEKKGMISPLFTSGDETTWAPSGIDHHDGNLYVAALRGTAILGFDLETGEQWEVITGLGRIRDVFTDDANLYFITNNSDGRGTPYENDDKLYKIKLNE